VCVCVYVWLDWLTAAICLFRLGFDDVHMDMFFMALDPERVGLDNIENGTVCDFGHNSLVYTTALSSQVVESDSRDSDNDLDNDDMMPDDISVDDDEDDDVLTDLLSDDFVAFLKS
jgi:hypothetical protein